jgi:hypothetical protein
MSMAELELALKVANRAHHRESPLEPLMIPNELKHLSPVDWEIVDSLYLTLEVERAWSPVH